MTMDQKLKALKVVDLKSILVAASVAIPTKVTKPELIARILASQPALDAYHRQYEPSDDLLAPPEDVDWNVDQPDLLAVDPQPVVADDPPKPPPPAPPSTTIPAPSPPKVVDSELERRKQRAARFGIPLVENAPKSTGKPTAAPLPQAALTDDAVKLSSRAARFGITNPVAPTPAIPHKAQKRTAVTEIDPEELERRKRRAERFGGLTTV